MSNSARFICEKQFPPLRLTALAQGRNDKILEPVLTAGLKPCATLFCRPLKRALENLTSLTHGSRRGLRIFRARRALEVGVSANYHIGLISNSYAAFSAITWKARATWSFKTVNSATSADFLGLMTTSTASAREARLWRTASRKRRLMRLR